MKLGENGWEFEISSNPSKLITAHFLPCVVPTVLDTKILDRTFASFSSLTEV